MAAKTILLIDDDPYILDVMGRQLKAKGFRVLSTTDPEQGCAIAEKESPDLILSDIAMPGIDGFAVIQWVRNNEKTRKIPLILLTGSDKMADVEKGFAAGAQAYLLKPVDWDAAWAKIEPFLK